MHALVEDFLFSLRHERGQAEHTQKTYAGLLEKFLGWAGRNQLINWRDVQLTHLTAFLENERDRRLTGSSHASTGKLSASSLYLQIAAFRAFFKWAETEKHLPANPAENLSLPPPHPAMSVPSGWKRQFQTVEFVRPSARCVLSSLCVSQS
ncbi:MAG: hypothetical protein EB141_18345 [Verrucomicrobia bacterium]|nr:hypothetical protein [Verrucomicrobiota bacterium]